MTVTAKGFTVPGRKHQTNIYLVKMNTKTEISLEKEFSK